MDKVINSGRFALITGGSSGLGECFVKIFAKDGYNILITAKDEAGLKKIAEATQKEFNVKVNFIALDLSLQGSCKQLFDWVKNQNIRISCLVNNAGIGNFGKFSNIPIEKELELVEVNTKALTELCHRFLPEMAKAKDGKILNIASLASFQPGPYFATYYASKAYVLSLTEALAIEYKKDNVTLSALCPGPMSTNFFKGSGLNPSKFMLAQMTNPQIVAQIGYKGLMKGKTVIIPGAKNFSVPLTARFLPRNLMARVSQQFVKWAAKDKERFNS